MSFERADVICPFYRNDNGKRSLVCEGLEDPSTLCQHFGTKKQMEAYMEHYCYRHCLDCEIFRMLLRAKYSDD